MSRLFCASQCTTCSHGGGYLGSFYFQLLASRTCLLMFLFRRLSLCLFYLVTRPSRRWVNHFNSSPAGVPFHAFAFLTRNSLFFVVFCLISLNLFVHVKQSVRFLSSFLSQVTEISTQVTDGGPNKSNNVLVNRSKMVSPKTDGSSSRVRVRYLDAGSLFILYL